MLHRLRSKAAKARSNAKLRITGRILAALFVVLGSLDVVSTNAALAAGHFEGNPIVQLVQAQIGSWWALPKMAFHLLLAWYILWLPSKRMIRVAGLVTGVYAVVVMNNFYWSQWSV
ncbi:MAG: DUF5658 family protein [Kiloniellaceae bacterium]